MIFRYFLITLLAFIAISVLRRYFFGGGRRTDPTSRDGSKEVKNASFRQEDIQDAKFKDM
jgi:hypothetical protein